MDTLKIIEYLELVERELEQSREPLPIPLKDIYVKVHKFLDHPTWTQ